MAIFITAATLAAALAVGIAIGSRLARATLGFLPSLYTHIAMFVGLCAAGVYLTDKPLVLAAVACTLVSTSVFWLARKTAPDAVPTSAYQNHAVNEPEPARVTHRVGNVITPSPSRWTRPFGRRNTLAPERTTPTGKTIRLASSSDANRTRKRGDLKAVK